MIQLGRGSVRGHAEMLVTWHCRSLGDWFTLRHDQLRPQMIDLGLRDGKRASHRIGYKSDDQQAAKQEWRETHSGILLKIRAYVVMARLIGHQAFMTAKISLNERRIRWLSR
ncbi:MAG: hypothetical protein ABJA62_05050 [Luteimonas sp.]